MTNAGPTGTRGQGVPSTLQLALIITHARKEQEQSNNSIRHVFDSMVSFSSRMHGPQGILMSGPRHAYGVFSFLAHLVGGSQTSQQGFLL